jgi:hypothetical protein
MTTAATASRRPAVRAPFRVLAALLCLSFIGAAVGMAIMIWRNGLPALRVQDVLLLPGMLWFLRLAFYAAARGTVPPQDNWPFATARVAGIYWLIFLCVSAATDIRGIS